MVVEVGKQVIIICTIIANNNYNKPTVDVDKIISCNNIYNEKLEILDKKEKETKEKRNTYIINNSKVVINE